MCYIFPYVYTYMYITLCIIVGERYTAVFYTSHMEVTDTTPRKRQPIVKGTTLSGSTSDDASAMQLKFQALKQKLVGKVKKR